MIAALQRVLSLAWLFALAGALFVGPMQGVPAALTTLTVPALLLGHGAVLAFEFVWMHRANRVDQTPRATLGQLLAAWLKEALHSPLVFLWRQPWQSVRWPDHCGSTDPSAPPRRGLVLVHGYFCNRGLWNRWMRTCHGRGITCVAVDLEPAFGGIEDYAHTIEAAVEAVTRATGAPPVVVAHSMGGLAVRRWWASASPDALHRLITIATPHHGTRLARLATTRNARQMRESSDWLQALQAAESPNSRTRTTCFYSHCDNIVFPASRAVLDGAEVVHLPATPHVAMVDHPAVWQRVEFALRTP